MHKTATGEKIKELKAEAAKFEREAATLRRVRGMDPGAREREREAARLRELADGMKGQTRLEDLSVYKAPTTKTTAKGEAKTYVYWYASWWEGTRARNVYIGSAAKLTREEALEKARELKAEALGLDF